MVEVVLTPRDYREPLNYIPLEMVINRNLTERSGNSDDLQSTLSCDVS